MASDYCDNKLRSKKIKTSKLLPKNLRNLFRKPKLNTKCQQNKIEAIIKKINEDHFHKIEIADSVTPMFTSKNQCQVRQDKTNQQNDASEKFLELHTMSKEMFLLNKSLISKLYQYGFEHDDNNITTTTLKIQIQ